MSRPTVKTQPVENVAVTDASGSDTKIAWEHVYTTSPPELRRWLDNSKPVAMHQDALMVAVPNNFTRNQLEGRFRPEPVTVGRRGGGMIEIITGLTAGDIVVSAATFLIDAESNLQSALQGLEGHAGHGAPSGTTEDPHAGHGEDAVDPHAGHVDEVADPHAGHAIPATSGDPPAAASDPGASDGHDSHGDHGTMNDHGTPAPATSHEGH